MRIIRTSIGCITDKQIEQYRNASKSTQPCHDKLTDMSLYELVMSGAEVMKKDGFSIVSDGKSLEL